MALNVVTAMVRPEPKKNGWNKKELLTMPRDSSVHTYENVENEGKGALTHFLSVLGKSFV
jgi:hypothetical protein